MTAARCSVGVEDKVCTAVPMHAPHTDNYDCDLCLLPSFTTKKKEEIRGPNRYSAHCSLKGLAYSPQFLDMWKEWLFIFGGLGLGIQSFGGEGAEPHPTGSTLRSVRC